MSTGTEYVAAFVNAFREARSSEGISQQAVAENMSTSGHRTWRQSTVAKVEAGTRPLLLSEAVDLAKIVGIGMAIATPTRRRTESVR